MNNASTTVATNNHTMVSGSMSTPGPSERANPVAHKTSLSLSLSLWRLLPWLNRANLPMAALSIYTRPRHFTAGTSRTGQQSTVAFLLLHRESFRKCGHIQRQKTCAAHDTTVQSLWHTENTHTHTHLDREEKTPTVYEEGKKYHGIQICLPPPLPLGCSGAASAKNLLCSFSFVVCNNPPPSKNRDEEKKKREKKVKKTNNSPPLPGRSLRRRAFPNPGAPMPSRSPRRARPASTGPHLPQRRLVSIPLLLRPLRLHPPPLPYL